MVNVLIFSEQTSYKRNDLTCHFFSIQNLLAIHIKYYYFDSHVYINTWCIINFIQMIKKKGKANNPDLNPVWKHTFVKTGNNGVPLK